MKMINLIIIGVVIIAVLITVMRVEATVMPSVSQGFLNFSPSVDPDGTAGGFSGYMLATIDVSPASDSNITEIGFYSPVAHSTTNIQFALYSHNASTYRPQNLLYQTENSTKTSGVGWYPSLPMNYQISANTTYWIAVRANNTVSIDYTNNNTELYCVKIVSYYPSPPTSMSCYNRTIAIYAKYVVSSATAGNTTASNCTYYNGTGNWEITNVTCNVTTQYNLLKNSIIISNSNITFNKTAVPTNYTYWLRRWNSSISVKTI